VQSISNSCLENKGALSDNKKIELQRHMVRASHNLLELFCKSHL